MQKNNVMKMEEGVRAEVKYEKITMLFNMQQKQLRS